MPRISVVVPCYQTEERLLLRCIKSILRQSFKDLEIIVIDDGNTEAYRSIYKEQIFKEPRIKVHLKSNEGVSAARNLGVQKASGEYIVFADADDALFENFLLEAISIAEKNKADLVIGGDVDYTKMKQTKQILNKVYPVIVFKDDDVCMLKRYMLGKKLYRFKSNISAIGQGPWTRLVRKDVAMQIHFDTRLPIGEDIVWNLQLLEICKTVCVAETVWYGYYYNPASSSRRFRENAIQESYDSLMCMKQYLNMNDDGEYYALCSRAFIDLHRIFYCYLGNIQNKINHTERKKAEKVLYTSQPWAEINNQRYIRLCSPKEMVSLLLYKHRRLFDYYSLKRVLTKG